MAGDCPLEAREAQLHPQQRPLINDVMPGGSVAVTRAEQGSEAQHLAAVTASLIGRNPLRADGAAQPNTTDWSNLRAIQTIMANDGFQFREGFPTAGGVSIEQIQRIMTGATRNGERLVVVPNGQAKEGDVVARAAHAAEIGRETCGKHTQLGIMQADGSVSRFNSVQGVMQRTTGFFANPQPYITLRIQH